MVIRSTEQASAEVWVPGEAVSLFLMTSQTQIWGALSRRVFKRKQEVTKTLQKQYNKLRDVFVL